jgi:hypothetical protein
MWLRIAKRTRGPRTLAGGGDHPLARDGAPRVADIALSGDALDRIDEIVRPGVAINITDNRPATPARQPAARRR